MRIQVQQVTKVLSEVGEKKEVVVVLFYSSSRPTASALATALGTAARELSDDCEYNANVARLDPVELGVDESLVVGVEATLEKVVPEPVEETPVEE